MNSTRPAQNAARTKTTKDGRQLLSFSGRTGRMMTTYSREAGLFGAPCTDIIDLVWLPHVAQVQMGMAPKGPLERQLEGLLKGKDEVKADI